MSNFGGPWFLAYAVLAVQWAALLLIMIRKHSAIANAVFSGRGQNIGSAYLRIKIQKMQIPFFKN